MSDSTLSGFYFASGS